MPISKWHAVFFFSSSSSLSSLSYLWPCCVSLTEHINRFNNNVSLHLVRVRGASDRWDFGACVSRNTISMNFHWNLWFDLDAGNLAFMQKMPCTKCHRLDSMEQRDNMRKCTNRASATTTTTTTTRRLAAGSHFSAFPISRRIPLHSTVDIIDLAHCRCIAFRVVNCKRSHAAVHLL